MKLIENNTAQKLRGGYYTPPELSDFILKWAFSDGHKQNILEPSCGNGNFIENLLNDYEDCFSNCTAIELNEEEAEKAREKVRNHEKIQIKASDFFYEFNWQLKNERFDLIIGNPPYIRYQYLSKEQRETQSDILTSNGMKSNKLINAWVSFLVACVEMLDENGKIGMVIPAELMQVAYAEDLRLFLTENLGKITIITFKELVFPDVQQEVVLFLGEKRHEAETVENKISVIECTNSYTLEEEYEEIPFEYKDVDHTKDKWTKFFLSNNEIERINAIKEDHKFIPLKKIADVDIGITTGNNKYFSVKKETVEQYDLSSITLPLIGRSAHAHGIYFIEPDWQENVDKGLAAQLVYFPDENMDNFPEGHKAYIKWGEENRHNEGYKLGLRNHWYHIPSVWAPDAFILRRNDKYPKFVLNEINAVSTDTMHRVRFREGVDRRKSLLAYYNSITFAFTEIEGRSYGGGVLEVLPGEIEKIMLPDIKNIEEDKVDNLLKKIDDAIRKNNDIDPILDEVDKVVLIDHLGIDIEVVKTFRNIWKKLMNRRRERKEMKKKSK